MIPLTYFVRSCHHNHLVRVSCSFLLSGSLWLSVSSPSLAVEPSFGYYDDVPPIDQSEMDTMAERTREARKRLKHSPFATAVQPESVIPTIPLPPPEKDERDDVQGIDLQEVDELQKALKEMQSQAQKGEGSSSENPTTPEGSPPASPKSEPQKETEQEITSLTERVNALERLLVGTEERPGLAGLIGGWTRHNGFFLMSSNGDFFLRLPVLFQADYRTFPGGQNGTDPGVEPSTFILQRVRPMAHVRVWRYFQGLISPDFGNGMLNQNTLASQSIVQIPDGFGEWDYFSAFRIRLGKFKSPIGLEMLQGIQNLSFMERSLTRNLLPNRDIGAMVWGVLQHGALEYQAGVFNGAPNANFYQDTKASSSSKTVEARVFTRPFIDHPLEWLRGLGAGVGMSTGSVNNVSGQENMQTETFSYTFFSYNSQVKGDGNRFRIAPQIAWYYNRVGLLGEYVRSTQHLESGIGPDRRTTNEAWTAQMSILLTDDTATFGHIEPRQPFNWSKRQWGAWEMAVRYAQLNIDPDNYTYNLADPTISVLRAKSTTVGLNWYLNSNIRITGNFVHSDFTGATPAYRAANHEDGLMFRTQLAF
jgi:phosphate-selective porin OprO/OprP